MKHDQIMSAPEDIIISSYREVQKEIQNEVKRKSTILLQIMVDYGWTDKESLNSLQRLTRFFFFFF